MNPAKIIAFLTLQETDNIFSEKYLLAFVTKHQKNKYNLFLYRASGVATHTFIPGVMRNG